MKIIGDGSPNHYMVLVNFRRQVSYSYEDNPRGLT